MGKDARRFMGALILTLVMVVPPVPAAYGGYRAVPDITVHVSTLSTGNAAETVAFDIPGTDTSLSLSLPNGATILAATLNVSGLPLTDGGRDYPENVTIDVGPQLPAEWSFADKGYGDLGHQQKFVSGSTNSSLRFGMNAVNASYFHLPKEAQVLSANCTINGSSTSAVTVTAGAQGTNVYPFGSGSFRFQWLYLAGEINTGGVLDRAGWKVNSGQGGTATLSNFKMKLCNTTVTALTGDFGGNYGGASPVTVIDVASQQIAEAGGYVTLDPPDVFFYDSTKSLLIEVEFSDRQGTGFGLNAGSVAGASGARRAWGSYGSTSGNVDGNAYRYECKMDFISKLNLAVDACGDTVVDYTNTSSDFRGVDLVFTDALGKFMETAPVNFTDKYGTAFVTVPISMYMEFSGNMILSGLSVTYRYTATVDEVKGLGNLADALSELLPSQYDGKYSNITLAISSTKPGKVKISGVSVDFRPPVHPPFIDSHDPGQADLAMNENQTQHFSVDASDEYGYPLTAVWYLDTLEAARDRFNFSFYADYESAGAHTVSVTVNNTMRSALARWNITVVNVNRPPVVVSFSPAELVNIREEESVNLGVVGSDPDSQDRDLRYNWYVGAAEQGVTGDSFRFKTNLSSSGFYTIRVKVSDAGGLSASQSWKVTVQNVNVPPVVDKLSPSFNPSIKETDTASFSISATDFDRQTLTYRWFLDGAEAGAGQQYAYRAGYDAAGTHLVQVVISDGEANISRNWTVTVENLNRPPIPVIDRPAGGLEFMDTEPVNFSAASSLDPDGDALRFRWVEGQKELSAAPEFERRFPPGAHEVTLEVTDSNRAVNRTTVKFTVRFIKLVANIEYDLLAPVEGNRLTFSAWVNNTGDAEASAVGVEFFVDGVSIGTQTIERIAGGGTGQATFAWKAKKGEHVLTARIGGQGWNSTVTVAARPPPPEADLTWLYIIGAVVAVAAVGGGLFLAVGRGKGGRPAPGPGRLPAPPEPAAPEPVRPMARTGAAALAAPPPAPSTEDNEARLRARKLIVSTQERIADLIENPVDGVDVTAAMGTLDKAQNALKAGEPKEALRLAKQARSSLAAAAVPPATKPPEKRPPVESAKAATCQHCGEKLEPGWGICPSCGKTV